MSMNTGTDASAGAAQATAPASRDWTLPDPLLTSYMGNFSEGLTLVCGDNAVWFLDLAVVGALGAGDCLLIDGGNLGDPLRIGRVASTHGTRSWRVMEALHIARAFTVHQLVALFEDVLPRELAARHARGERVSLVALYDPLSMFSDRDVEGDEGFALLGRSLEALSQQTKNTAIMAACPRPAAKHLERRFLGNADRVISFYRRSRNHNGITHRGDRGNLWIRDSSGTEFTYSPLPEGQRILDHFCESSPLYLDRSEQEKMGFKMGSTGFGVGFGVGTGTGFSRGATSLSMFGTGNARVDGSKDNGMIAGAGNASAESGGTRETSGTNEKEKVGFLPRFTRFCPPTLEFFGGVKDKGSEKA